VSEKLGRRVAAAAQAALDEHSYVSPVEVLVRIGWLSPNAVEAWRRGGTEELERAAAVSPDRLAAALATLREWARAAGLDPDEIAYVARTRDRRPLHFTANGDPDAELAYRTHWVSPKLPAAARERLNRRQSAPPDLVVTSPLKDWTCTGCGGTDTLLFMEDNEALCLTCADLDHLVYLGAGDAALTRRAKKASTLSAVVVRFSRARKRYERQGILVERAALELAEQQCLGDEEARLRRRERDRERRAEQDEVFVARLADEVVRMFPGCPRPRAEAIAAHAGARGSGRVGRSAAGRALTEDATTLAVVASVRHEDTNYDLLLMSGVPRAEARDQVRGDIDRVLDSWRRQPPR
jgi:hypothetical protein